MGGGRRDRRDRDLRLDRRHRRPARPQRDARPRGRVRLAGRPRRDPRRPRRGASRRRGQLPPAAGAPLGCDGHVDVHIVVDPDLTVRDSHAIADRIETAVEDRLPSADVVVHIEPAGAEPETDSRVAGG
ncbi:MAG: hypothetical protein FJW81_03925 [Actinobacteria bacterium]|nr:hypothetical protein [Actinomycetota bacterium]